MKPVNFTWAALVFVMLSACSKRDVPQPDNAEKSINDSVSYVVNGKKYTSNTVEKGMTWTTQSNTKITSGVNFNYLIQGDQDSLLFVRDITIKADQSYMILSFIKIYHKDETVFASENNGGWLQYPKDRTAIFAPGPYKYVTDLWRGNSTSGIAVRIINVNGEFRTWGQTDLGKPASVTQADMQGSKFEITSIQKRKSDYLIEGKFNVTVFDENRKLQRIEDGYLRFSVLKILNIPM